MTELQMLWGWQPALYLFFGGMGAGAVVMAAVLFFFDKKRHKKTISISLWVATICLALGLLFLLTELTNPLKGLMLWQSFSNFSSWMTIGAWIIFIALLVFALSAVVFTEKLIDALRKNHSTLAGIACRSRKVLIILGLILGLSVAVYTGILLMVAPGIPLWNTVLLPMLFTVSALETGIALVEIIAIINAKKETLTQKAIKSIEYCIVGLVILELCILGIFIAVMLSGNGLPYEAAETANASISLLLVGALSPYFWVLVVAIGLLMPLVAVFLGLKSHARKKVDANDIGNDGSVTLESEKDEFIKSSSKSASADASELIKKKATPSDAVTPDEEKPLKLGTASVIGAIGTLVGGCALRFLILLAGLHVDYIATTALEIIKEISI